MWGISRLADELSASEELCPVEIVKRKQFGGRWW
jgi:hypothetical protein